MFVIPMMSTIPGLFLMDAEPSPGPPGWLALIFCFLVMNRESRSWVFIIIIVTRPHEGSTSWTTTVTSCRCCGKSVCFGPARPVSSTQYWYMA